MVLNEGRKREGKGGRKERVVREIEVGRRKQQNKMKEKAQKTTNQKTKQNKSKRQTETTIKKKNNHNQKQKK